MKQTKKRIMKVVGVLTDPHPQFVSLVGHGANQTPFTVLKAAERPNDGESDMKLKQSAKEVIVKKGEAVMQRMVFSADVFGSKKSVSDYLSKKGYEDFGITQSKDGEFEVISADEKTLSDISSIEVERGVTAYVGIPVPEEEEESTTKDADLSPDLEGSEVSAADDESSESPTDEEEVKATSEEEEENEEKESGKSEDDVEIDPAIAAGEAGSEGMESVSRFDEFMAFYSTSTDLKEVLAQGADGLPPGFYEITTAMITATQNALLAGDSDAVKSTMDQYGDMVIKMAKAMSSATVPKSVVEKMIFSPEELAAKEEAKKESEEEKEEVTPDAEDASALALKSLIGEALAENLQGITDGIEEMKTTVTKQVEGVVESTQKLSEQMDEISGRLDVVENTPNVRKSLDAEGTQKDELKGRREISQTTRNNLGFANRN